MPNHAKLEEVTGLTMPVFVANGDSDRLTAPISAVLYAS